VILGVGACAKRIATGPAGQRSLQVAQGLPAEVQPVLSELATSTDPVLRGEALSVELLALEAPAGGPRLGAALYDPSPWVQRQGVEVLLARLAEPEAQDALVAYAKRPDVSPHTACTAAQQGGARGPASLTDALTAVVHARLEQERRPWLRLPCLLALAASGRASPDQDAELEGVLLEGSLPLDASFVRHLFRTAPPAVDPALGALPELVEDVMLLPVVVGLVERDHPAAERRLQELLRRQDAELALGLALSLGELDGELARTTLRSLGSHEDALVAQTARLLLSARGPTPAADLERALQSDELEMRLLALELLGQALPRVRAEGGQRALERLASQALDTALAAERPRERAAGLVLLAAVGGPRARERAVELLSAEEAELRLEAARAVTALSTVGSP
jgi:HEAT repeat protein